MIIAVVGAGGKTTISRKIAYELSQMGCRALMTTTTKIYHPKDSNVYIGPAKQIQSDRLFMTAAKAKIENGKLQGYTPAEIEQMRMLFDYIIVEADGANRKPIKAPNEKEPVYPLHSDIIIGVIGLDCLDNPISDERVHRAALFADLTQAQFGDIITASHLIRLIRHPYGLFRGAPERAKKIVFLNKIDAINETKKEQLKSVIDSALIPVLVTGWDTDWFSGFYAAYMEGCL